MKSKLNSSVSFPNSNEEIDMEQIHSKKKFATVKQVSQMKEYDFLSENSLRWWIFMNERDFKKKVVRKIGRKILLSLSDLDSWLDSQRAED